MEAKKKVSSRLKTLNETNKELPNAEKKQITAQNDKILVNGIIDEQEISTPQPSDLFLDSESQKVVDDINKKFAMTDTTTVKNSSFVALALEVKLIEQVRVAYIAAAQRFASMDHIMMAYGLKENETIKMGSCDDSEHGSSAVIRRAMAKEKARNMAVFVIRRYGGLHLGMDRFTTIETIAREAIKLWREHSKES